MDFIISAFEKFDFSSVQMHIVWLVLTYGVVLLAMLVDLIMGILKAKKAGIARTSTGYKMSCTKAEKYFLPMMCLTCIDLLASVILAAPFFTMAFGAFNVFCEWKSVLEKTHEKQELRDAANTMQVVVKNKEDIAQIIVDVMNKMANNTKDEDRDK